MKPLTELHSATALKLSYPELLQKCEEVYMRRFYFHLAKLNKLRR